MRWRETEKMKHDSKLAEEKRKYAVYCKNCGWRNHIYYFENDRKICKNCHNWIYKDEKTKFNYTLKEVMNKCKSSN